MTIGIENVWNKFLTGPGEFPALHRPVRLAADRGLFRRGQRGINGYPEHWIEILGPRIKAVHVKNFKRRDCGGVIQGFGEDLAEGDVNFAAVKAQLSAIDYRGPITAEMIPFSRLPDLNLPDMDLARKTAETLKRLFP